ncbi:MAG: UDP-N-acetylglucosamine 1-carboxyvinyltransferase [Vampirovibrionales bacterium]
MSVQVSDVVPLSFEASVAPVQQHLSSPVLSLEAVSPLRGEVRVSGAKNSVLKLMAACLLTDEEVCLYNVPNLSDVQVMAQVVNFLGKRCELLPDGGFVVYAGKPTHHEAPYELVSQMRASFNVLGALLGRCGEARVSLPGGCSIGKRGVDLHLKGLSALGAELVLDHGYVHMKAHQLRAAHITLDFPSVGATENIMLAAVFAQGTTVISNVAQEPEIIDLVNFLNFLGADIHGAGTSEITINGVQKGTLRGGSYTVVPDRIEAVTYLLLGASRIGSEVLVKDFVPEHLDIVLTKLEDMGVQLKRVSKTSMLVSCTQRLRPVSVLTQPYPGFPTDLQAPFMAILTVAEGTSVLSETIYENRFRQVGELERMGASIQISGNVAVVNGVSSLTGTQVEAHDLRAGAAMIVAAAIAEGETQVTQLHHLDRGYEFLEQKLQGLGMRAERHQ